MKQHHRVSWLGGIIFVVLAFFVSSCSNPRSTTTASNVTSTFLGTPTIQTTPVQNQPTSSTSSTSPISSLPTLPLTQIRMTDTTHGWALNKTDVLKTSDGGKSWVALTPKGATIFPTTEADFLNARDAWLTVPNLGGTITIFYTTTGGASWKHSSIHEPSSDGGLLTFISNETGWLEISPGGRGAGSEPVDIFRTDNGGATWNKISSSSKGQNPLPTSGYKSGISFVNGKTGWVSGENSAIIPWLYITHDGGRTWHRQAIAGTSNENASYLTYAPLVLGNSGFLPMTVMSSTPHTILARSTDGGTSWTVQGQQLAPLMSSNVCVMNAHDAWATDQNTGDVYYTNNGGKTWQKIAGHTSIYGPLSFINTTTGFGLGHSDQTILKRTDDGGKTWQTIPYQIHGA